MSKLIINGGKKLQGTIKPVPNKNSIIKLIPACILANEPVILHNVPKTSDVKFNELVKMELATVYIDIEGFSKLVDQKDNKTVSRVMNIYITDFINGN